MSGKLQIILLAVLLMLVVLLIRQLKRKRLDLKYTLSWLLLVGVLIILVIFPGLLLVLTDFLGIATPVNMIFFCGFCFALVIIYTLTVAVSRMADDIRCLAQKIALLEKEKGEDDEEE